MMDYYERQPKGFDINHPAKAKTMKTKIKAFSWKSFCCVNKQVFMVFGS